MITVRDHLDALADTAVAVVTFAPVEDLAAYHRYLELPFPVLSDADRQWYHHFGFVRTSRRRVYNAGTLRLYRQLLRQGRQVQRPTQDTRQLGGEVVFAPDGTVHEIIRPPSPDARPGIDVLLRSIETSRQARPRRDGPTGKL